MWPSNEFKRKINLNFYSKPVYNYRLECDLDQETTKEKFIEQYNVDLFASSRSALETYKVYPIVILVTILAVPLAGIPFYDSSQVPLSIAILIPFPIAIAFVICAGLFIKPMLLTFEASSELSTLASNENYSY